MDRAIIFALIIMSICVLEYNLATAVVAPHWEYDLIIKSDYSLQLFVNRSTYEKVVSITYDENHTEISREIHGKDGETGSIFWIKNNGKRNLTNLVVLSGKKLIKVVPILRVNETICIDPSHYYDIQILTQQGVYAHIYPVTPYPSTYYQEFAVLIQFLLPLLVVGDIASGFLYIKKRKTSYLVITLVLIALTILTITISFLLSYQIACSLSLSTFDDWNYLYRSLLLFLSSS